MMKAFDRAMTMTLASLKRIIAPNTKPASGWQLAAIFIVAILPIPLPPRMYALLPVGIVGWIIARVIWRRMLPLRERARLADEENDRRQRTVATQASKDA
ncbi:MAG: hypothetical protein WA702_17585 [Bradyrhizobium sp.]|uniref:hypothetical protein n=1 Tax=Bradyrhizobium sp. TaxID=376 RepID=UPI003C7CA951